MVRTTDYEKILFLIGTSHIFQKGLQDAPEGCYIDFREMVQQAVRDRSVQTLSEEMSVEALGNTISLCKKIASELDIFHIFCDPNDDERLSLGLPAKDDSSTWSGREEEWLSRLKLASFPVLFICGANHVDSFQKKCRNQGITVTVLESDWASATSTPPECWVL